jgi:hypothetical protein
MNNEKAREYFSAYAEGSLDAGLAQSFEAKLKADAELRQEYDQFEATLKELDTLRFEKIEVPFDLNDRVSAAIDKSLYENKRTATPSWTMWLRNLSFAGLAAAALFGAVYTLNLNGGSVTNAGPIGEPVQVKPRIEQIQYSKIAGGVQMEYRPSEKHTVLIKGGAQGEETFNVSGRGWINELKNDQPNAAIFTVEVKGEQPPMIVVVPGTTRPTVKAGQGTLVELAKAVADFYGVPVVVKSASSAIELSWNFGTGSASQETSNALQGIPCSTDLRETGVLWIQDH